MRYIAVLIFAMLGYTAQAQWTIINGKQRFAKGLGIPVSDTVATLLNDSAQIVLRPQDSAIYYKYKGKWQKASGSGGDGTIPTLQSVTNAGATTNQNVKVNTITIWDPFQNDYTATISGNNIGGFTFTDKNDEELIKIGGSGAGPSNLTFGNTANGKATLIPSGSNPQLTLPGYTGTIALLSDITAPDTNTIATHTYVDSSTKTKIDSLKRSTDSVFARKNGSWVYQYKDSVANVSNFVPYTGATQELNLGSQKLTQSGTLYNITLDPQTNISIKIANKTGGGYTDIQSGQIYFNNPGQGTTRTRLLTSPIDIDNNGRSVYLPVTKSSDYYDTLATLRDLRGTNGTTTAIDSLKRQTDSVFARKNGSWIYQYNGFVPYSGATTDVDLGTFSLNAKSVKINGTAGNGHIDLKHQSSDAPATGSSTVLFANSNGDLKWKNDGAYYTTLKTQQTADRIYTWQNKSYTLGDSADIAAKLNTSDSTVYFSKYRSDTMRNNIYNQLAQELNISDTATMLSKYLRKTDTASLSSRIDAKGYAINFGAVQSTYAASTTYYFGMPSATIATSANVRRVYIPASGTVRQVYMYARTANGTAGETWSMIFRLTASGGGTSTTTIGSTNNTSNDKVFFNSNLNVAVSAGDYFEITTTCPATAPGISNIFGTLIIQ